MVVMGRVRAPHGLKGWIKVQPFTREREGLLEYRDWWLVREGQWQRHRVEESAVQGSMVVARLQGVSDREVAAGLKGSEVAVPRAAMPENPEGEFYWSDLLGLEVFGRNSANLGRVEKILETGANAVLVVRGEKETLVPFIQDVVVDVDVAAGRIVLDWESD
ncbi:MAG TPA: ribosome maturation factor RimM [Burkholderiales bacterium]|nr:ribosome maturation factor RimM [Burkholderiales bacterium]